MTRTDPTPDVEEATRRAGFDDLRPQQRRCVDALLDGRDTLAVIPTGGGKSAIYQIAGSIIDGPTIVITPLLALQQDQRESIDGSNLPAARAIDGSTSAEQRSVIVADLAAGAVEFLFLTPETLITDDMLDALEHVGVSLFVIDEAHCIVSWGHGFRPAYLDLGRIRQRLGGPTCLALTASADPRMRDDICRHLALDHPVTVVDDLERHNIAPAVRIFPDRRAAEAGLIADLVENEQKTIVYAPTCAGCESIAAQLEAGGRTARPFHGRLDAATKRTTLEWFRRSSDGVVVATTAFGMGIDIGDVTAVRHLDLPGTLIDYYQEIGRAGRNGEPASAVAYVGARRRSRRAFSGGVRRVDVEDCAAVVGAIVAGATSKKAVAARSGMSAGRVTRAVTVLDIAGAVRQRPSLELLDASIDDDTIEEICVRRTEFDCSQQQALERYADSAGCRWMNILAALGEQGEPCSVCDRCQDRAASGDADTTSDDGQSDSLIGRRLRHQSFGLGTVSLLDHGSATVTFDDVGPKELDLDLCIEHSLVSFPGTDAEV